MSDVFRLGVCERGCAADTRTAFVVLDVSELCDSVRPGAVRDHGAAHTEGVGILASLDSPDSR